MSDDRDEPTLACLKRAAHGWKFDMGEWYLPFSGTPAEPMSKAEREVMASLNTEAGEV